MKKKISRYEEADDLVIKTLADLFEVRSNIKDRNNQVIIDRSRELIKKIHNQHETFRYITNKLFFNKINKFLMVTEYNSWERETFSYLVPCTEDNEKQILRIESMIDKYKDPYVNIKYVTVAEAKQLLCKPSSNSYMSRYNLVFQVPSLSLLRKINSKAKFSQLYYKGGVLLHGERFL